MSELQAIKKEPTITRRQFLKLSGLTAAVTGLASIWTQEEINIGKEGIKTPSGVFKFVYELHDRGINPEDIPSDTDVFFREGAIKKLNTYNSYQMVQLLTVEGYSQAGKSRIFTDEVLKRISTIKSSICFGDIDVPGVLGDEFLTKFAVILPEFFLGFNLLLRKIKKHGVDSVDDRVDVKKDRKINRRAMLKKLSLLTAGVWLISPMVGLIASGLGVSSEQKVLERIGVRIGGLQSHLHPEQFYIFIRNLVMADKLLMVGEEMTKQLGKPAIVTLQVGAGHSGIEDMIRLGHDFCRNAIKAIPKPILDEIINYNGGVDSLVMSRLMKFDREITNSDLSKKDLSEFPITQSQISDEVLKEMLRK